MLPVTLNKTFLTLQFMMKHIMMHEGSKDLRLGHIRKDALLRIGELSATLPWNSRVFQGDLAFLARKQTTGRREAAFLSGIDVLRL